MKNKTKNQPVQTVNGKVPSLHTASEKSVSSAKKMNIGIRFLLILLVLAAFVGFCCLLAFSLENGTAPAS